MIASSLHVRSADEDRGAVAPPPRSRRLWWAGVGLAGVLCVAAVVMTAGQPGGSTEPRTADPCRLLSTSQARAVLGTDVVRQREAQSCTFMQKGRLRSVTLTIVPQAVDPATFGKDLEGFAGRVGARREAVRGLGDEAYTIIKSSIAQLQVRSGERAFAIVLLNVDRDEARARDLLLRLGREAAGRFG